MVEKDLFLISLHNRYDTVSTGINGNTPFSTRDYIFIHPIRIHSWLTQCLAKGYHINADEWMNDDSEDDFNIISYLNGFIPLYFLRYLSLIQLQQSKSITQIDYYPFPLRLGIGMTVLHQMGSRGEKDT